MHLKRALLVTLTFLLALFKLIRTNNCDPSIAICKDDGTSAERSTCSTCLNRKSCCSWCTQSNYTGNRCGTSSELEQQNCPIDEIIQGEASNVNTLEDADLSDTDGNEEAVQIKPQRIKLRLRQGEPVTFSFKYRAAKNYPIQLYYLMDLTNSMKAHKESLVKIGKELGGLLQNLTLYYKIGFGYYADKVAMPFYKMTPLDLANPCEMLYGETCSQGFAFVHAQDFTSDIDTFVQKVDKSNFTSNLDDLENGFESIIQILQCDKHISWQKTSRKMIVMATNSLLHMAGDGILAGVTKRHPGGCILNAEGVLEDYLAYDYPSLEEVQKALEHKKVQLVLTGAENPVHKEYYNSLHKQIPGVSVFVNEREIIGNIRSGYEQVTQRIFFVHNNTNNYLDIKYRSTCNDTEDTSAVCLNTTSETTYNFYVHVRLDKVPGNLKEDLIVISEMNIDQSLEVLVEYIVNSKCDCQDADKANCSGHGTFECGKCLCHDTWYGANCSKQCTINNCRFSNSTYTSTTCSSKGECDLDNCTCICEEDTSGNFCEAPNCAKDSLGRICSGHGLCNNGVCQCTRDYSGEICECLTSTKNCYKDNSTTNDVTTICGGHGDCVCNKCVCRSEQETTANKTQSVIYMGDYCQHCLNCTHTCSKYKNCIVANVENKLKEAYCDPAFPKQVEDKEREYEDACTGEYYNIHNQLCTTSFILLNNTIVYKDNGCPEVQAAGIFILIPILAILALGLLVLITWKAVVRQKDNAEMAKFKMEQRANEFHELSPIYKDPITTFRNPTYPNPENSFN